MIVIGGFFRIYGSSFYDFYDEFIHDPPVLSMRGEGVLHSYNNKDVLEMRTNAASGEWLTTGLLEYHRNDVVAYVTLSQQLER